MRHIFIDENNSCRFDLSSANWFIDNLNEIFHASNVPLKDVDFME